MSKLTNRYDTIPGCRLDDRENHNGAQGPALDLMNRRDGATLWVRQEDGAMVEIELSIENVWALREGCTRLLVDAGHERYERVAVPT